MGKASLTCRRHCGVCVAVAVMGGLYAALLSAEPLTADGRLGKKNDSNREGSAPVEEKEAWRERLVFSLEVETTARNEEQTWEIHLRSRVQHGWQQRSIALGRKQGELVELSLANEGERDLVEQQLVARRWIGGGRPPGLGGREFRRSRGGGGWPEPDPSILWLAPPKHFPYLVRVAEGVQPQYGVHAGPALSERMQREARQRFAQRPPAASIPQVSELGELSADAPQRQLSAAKVHDLLGIKRVGADDLEEQEGGIRFGAAEIALQDADDTRGATRTAEVKLPVTVRARRNTYAATLRGTLTFDAERHWPLALMLEAEVEPQETVNSLQRGRWRVVDGGFEGTVNLERRWSHNKLDPSVSEVEPDVLDDDDVPSLNALRTVLREALPQEHRAHDADSLAEALRTMTLYERELMRTHAHALADALRRTETEEGEEPEVDFDALTAVRDIPERQFRFEAE